MQLISKPIEEGGGKEFCHRNRFPPRQPLIINLSVMPEKCWMPGAIEQEAGNSIACLTAKLA
jgi:hypothetical protein